MSEEKQESKITIPDPRLDVLKIFSEKVGDIQKSHNFLTVFVIGVMLIGFLTLLFAISGLIVESWRYTSSTWKDSEQLKQQGQYLKEILESQKTISTLLKQMDTRLKR
ncbi:MAG: hypothetical protein HYS43_01835 [Candidatus Liptonbacteria bacterium]|nr:hypothetical protein [Candidatus Liptonbacteria bacterium]